MSTTSETQQARPNIVLIMADDLGYADLSCYGSETISTPQIDRLARNGMRFTDYHANGAVCSPTRAALLTGRYPQRCGIEDALVFGESQGLEPQPTLATYLKQQGYATGLCGKWHLGSEPQFHPNRHGFDEFYGLLNGDGDYRSRINRAGCRDWWHNEVAVEESGYTTDLITQHSLDFIDRHQAEPFFLYVAHLAPHFPWQGPEDPADRIEGTDYRESELKFGSSLDKKNAFREMVKAMDDGVGRIVAKLKELGLEENTLLIFLSDNGGYTVETDGYVAVSNHGPFRGQKRDIYEGGHRVPAIFSFPEMIPANTFCHDAAMSMDILPTLLDILGLIQASGEQALDGVSLCPVLTKGAPAPLRPLFWRQGDDKAVREGSWKLVIREDQEELFNLAEDPGERMNRAAEFPRQVDVLNQLLRAWELEVEPKSEVLSR